MYNAFELLDDVICIVFLVIVSTIAYKQMLTSWSMQTPALRLPQGINYLAILLGCVLMIVSVIYREVSDIRAARATKEKEGIEE